MEQNLSKMMVPFKVQLLVNRIIEKKGFCVQDAFQYLYSSDLYKQLSSEPSYLWQLSTPNLYDLLKQEKRLKRKGQNNTASILLFLTFCLENYKDHKKITAEETLFLFNQYDVFTYLEQVFDTLHTQSKSYIMAEIDSYIEHRNPSPHETISRIP